MFGNSQELSIVIKARDEASKVISSVERSASSLHKRLESAAGASRTFALGLAAGTAAIGGLGYAALKAAGDMEQTRIAFETMLGSASKADVFVKQLVNFAKTTPFELQGLNTAAKQLLAYGFAQEEIIPNLKALGDIASGVGMDKLPNLILAFGQVKAATRLTGMELRQFTEAGVPLLGMLAEQLGKPVSVIQEMVSAGEIGFSEVEKAIKSLTEEGGRFNNLMEKQSQSLGGMVSNLSDAWNIFLAGEGQKLLEWAKHFTEAAIYIVENVLPVWIDRISALVNWLGQHKIALAIVAGAILGALVPAIYAATLAFAALAISLAPFIIGGAIIAGIAYGVMWIIKHWDMLEQRAVKLWEAIPAPFRAGAELLIKIAERIANAFDRMSDSINNAFKRIQPKMPDWLPGLGAGAAAAGNSLLRAAGLPFPAFEHGGIVPGAEGMPVPIMAHGQERIIPAHGTQSDAPMILNFNFHDVVAGDDGVRRIIMEAASYFDRQATLSGIAGR